MNWMESEMIESLFYVAMLKEVSHSPYCVTWVRVVFHQTDITHQWLDHVHSALTQFMHTRIDINSIFLLSFIQQEVNSDEGSCSANPRTEQRDIESWWKSMVGLIIT